MLAAGTADPATRPAVAPGRGDLVVRQRGGRSVVTRAFATSPLRLLTPSNHGSAAWVYTASLGGGLVDGDDVRLDIDVGAGAAAFVSTQSATKVYRSPRGTTTTVRASVARGGLLVVAPDAVVPFAGARFRQVQRYDVAADAALVVVDALVAGRRASGERWRFLEFASSVEIRIDGSLRVYDALSLRAADGDLSARCGRFDVIATAFLAGAGFRGEVARLVAAAPEPVASRAEQIEAVSAAGDDACLVRVAGTTPERVWRRLRGMLDFIPARLGDDPWSRKW